MKKNIIMLLIIITLFMGISYVFQQINKKNKSYYDLITYSQLEKLNGKYDYLILFVKQNGCVACEQVEPIINDIAKDSDYKFVTIIGNVEENSYVYENLNISVTPTVIFFQKGQEKDRIIGIFNKKKLMQKINYMQREIN